MPRGKTNNPRGKNQYTSGSPIVVKGASHNTRMKASMTAVSAAMKNPKNPALLKKARDADSKVTPYKDEISATAKTLKRIGFKLTPDDIKTGYKEAKSRPRKK